MNEAERKSSTSCAAISTQFFFSVIVGTNRALRTRGASKRKAAREKEKEWSADTSFDSERPESNHKKKSLWRKLDGCHLCKVRYTQPVILEHIPFPAIESKPEGQPESANTSTSLVYLPITRTQPPRPPRRRSSLSYSKLRRNIYIEVSPSAPLSAFTLGEEDGRAWQWSVTRDSYQDPLWTLLLQVGSVESCVRHLVLTYAQLNSCPFRIPVDDECRRRRVRIHYHAALLMLRCGLGREMALIASYLLARIHSSLNDGSGATFWLQTGRRILKRALHDSTGGNDRCMRCVARALCREAWSGRVEIRT